MNVIVDTKKDLTAYDLFNCNT